MASGEWNDDGKKVKKEVPMGTTPFKKVKKEKKEKQWDPDEYRQYLETPAAKIHTDQLRQYIPHMVKELYNHTGKCKWEKPPDGWPANIFFGDPNNGKKLEDGKRGPKPNKDQLDEMYDHLRKGFGVTSSRQTGGATVSGCSSGMTADSYDNPPTPQPFSLSRASKPSDGSSAFSSLQTGSYCSNHDSGLRSTFSSDFQSSNTNPRSSAPQDQQSQSGGGDFSVTTVKTSQGKDKRRSILLQRVEKDMGMLSSYPQLKHNATIQNYGSIFKDLLDQIESQSSRISKDSKFISISFKIQKTLHEIMEQLDREPEEIGDNYVLDKLAELYKSCKESQQASSQQKVTSDDSMSHPEISEDVIPQAMQDVVDSIHWKSPQDQVDNYSSTTSLDQIVRVRGSQTRTSSPEQEQPLTMTLNGQRVVLVPLPGPNTKDSPPMPLTTPQIEDGQNIVQSVQQNNIVQSQQTAHSVSDWTKQHAQGKPSPQLDTAMDMDQNNTNMGQNIPNQPDFLHQAGFVPQQRSVPSFGQHYTASGANSASQQLPYKTLDQPNDTNMWGQNNQSLDYHYGPGILQRNIQPGTANSARQQLQLPLTPNQPGKPYAQGKPSGQLDTQLIEVDRNNTNIGQNTPQGEQVSPNVHAPGQQGAASATNSANQQFQQTLAPDQPASSVHSNQALMPTPLTEDTPLTTPDLFELDIEDTVMAFSQIDAIPFRTLDFTSELDIDQFMKDDS